MMKLYHKFRPTDWGRDLKLLEENLSQYTFRSPGEEVHTLDDFCGRDSIRQDIQDKIAKLVRSGITTERMIAQIRTDRLDLLFAYLLFSKSIEFYLLDLDHDHRILASYPQLAKQVLSAGTFTITDWSDFCQVCRGLLYEADQNHDFPTKYRYQMLVSVIESYHFNENYISGRKRVKSARKTGPDQHLD